LSKEADALREVLKAAKTPGLTHRELQRQVVQIVEGVLPAPKAQPARPAAPPVVEEPPQEAPEAAQDAPDRGRRLFE